MPRCSAPQDL
jgi:putative transposase